jgi:addiction module HigA family antidote
VSGNFRLIFDIDGEDATNVDFDDYHQEARVMEMFSPPHPGESVREDCLKPLKLTVTAAAASLGVSRQSMSELLNGRNGISADMALRLGKAGWGSAEAWMRNQTAYDLWQARHRDEALAPRARLKASRKSSAKADEKEILAAVVAAKRRARKKASAKPATPARKRA